MEMDTASVNGWTVSTVGPPSAAKNALISVMAIGEYDEDAFPNLPGTLLDCENAINTFVGKWNYKILYKLKNGKTVYSNDLKYIKQNNDFKLNWRYDDETDCDDIDSFVEETRQCIVKNKHDAFIFIISGHGGEQKVIYESDGSPYGLDDIFKVFTPQWYFHPTYEYDETEDERNHLFKIPKMFLMDCCRGQIGATPFEFDKNEDSGHETESDNDSKSDLENESETAIDSESEDSSMCTSDDSKEEEESKSESRIIIESSDDFIDSSESSESDESSLIISKGVSKMNITKEQSSRVFTEMSNFFKFYATTEGYSVGDSTNGGLFLKSVYQVFNDVNFVSTHSWDDIVLKIREYTKRHTTILSDKLPFIQMIESEGTLEKRLIFETNFQDSENMELEQLEPKQVTITNFSMNERIAVKLESEENREDYNEIIKQLCDKRFEDDAFENEGFQIIDRSGYNNSHTFNKGAQK